MSDYIQHFHCTPTHKDQGMILVNEIVTSSRKQRRELAVGEGLVEIIQQARQSNSYKAAQRAYWSSPAKLLSQLPAFQTGPILKHT